MKKKDFRDIEYYMIPGAEIRLLKAICFMLLGHVKLCPKTVTSKINRLYSLIKETGGTIEHQMFVDNWEKTDERHLSIFDGALTDGKAVNGIDADVRKLAADLMKCLLKDMED